MSLDDRIRAELQQLLHAVCEGQISAAAQARLESLVLDDPEARKYYVRFMQLHGALLLETTPLRGVLATPAQAGGDKCPERETLPEALTRSRRSPMLDFLRTALRNGRQVLTRHGVAAAIVLFAAIVPLAIWMAVSGGRPVAAREQGAKGPLVARGADSALPVARSAPAAPSAVLSAPPSGPVARLARAVDIRWGKGVEPSMPGGDLAAGQQIHLESGLAEIVCANGVELVLQGPAALTVESERNVFLAEGRLTARITRPEARGFTVRTPESVAVDEGTEFGVDVAPGGDQNIHVFQGKVQFSATSKDGEPLVQRQLTENQGARMRAETQAVNLVADAGEGFTRSLDNRGHDPHTVAYWRFEDQPVGTLVHDSAEGRKPVRGTIDCSGNGNDLFTWSAATAPRFSADVPAAAVARTGMANCGSLDNSAPLSPVGSRDLYTKSLLSHASPIDLQKICPRQWTVEASVKPAKLRHETQVFVGRDGSGPWSGKHLPSRLALSIDADDRFAVRFIDGDGRAWAAAADGARVQPGRWFHVAASSDGRQLRLYVDANDGRGYQVRAAADMAATGSTALGSGGDAAEWSVGRGKNAEGKPVAWFQGWIDEVRISDVARAPSEFLFAAPPAEGKQQNRRGRQ